MPITGNGVGALPHHSFNALRRLLDRLTLDVAHGNLPERIDRAYWEPLYGPKGESLGHQVTSTCRFFGLIEGPINTPTNTLWELVEPSRRKDILRDLLQTHYSNVLPVAQSNGVTRKELEQAFSDTYGITGATSIKGVAFFIAASQYAKLPIAPTLIPQSGPNTPASTLSVSTPPMSSGEAVEAPMHPLRSDERRIRQTTAAEVVEELEAADLVHFRMAARKTATDEWVVHTLIIDVFPAGWIPSWKRFEDKWALPSFYYNYGRVAFLAGSVPGFEARAWLLDPAQHTIRMDIQRRKVNALAFRFALPKWQDYVQATRIPSYQHDGFNIMPWPHTLYNLTLGPTNAEAQDFDFLVAEGCPFFHDFRTAVLSLVYGISQPERVSTMMAQDAVIIRVVAGDGWLEQVKLTSEFIAIKVQGMKLNNCRILFNRWPNVPSEKAIHGPGVITVPLSQGLPEQLWVVLARGSRWLDSVHWTGNQPVYLSTQANVVVESNVYEAKAANVEIDPKEQVRDLGTKIERALEALEAERANMSKHHETADEQSYFDEREAIFAETQDVAHVLAANPRAALLLVSAKLEQHLYRRLRETHVRAEERYIPIAEVVRAGIEARAYPPDVLKAFQTFWNMRNRVVHDPTLNMDDDTIAVMVSAGLDLLRTLTA